jgi:hypothetical protein
LNFIFVGADDCQPERAMPVMSKVTPTKPHEDLPNQLHTTPSQKSRAPSKTVTRRPSLAAERLADVRPPRASQ